MAGKRERQQRIVEILAHNQIENQEQIQQLLLAEGLVCSQTTLSRDLRELGVIKSEDGYRVPDGVVGENALARLARELAPRLRAADAGGSIAVLRPRESDASALARAIDTAGLPQVVASVACDGVILVVARTPADARRLASALAGRRSRRWRG
ncbi:MAG TPA: arginine repressor [Gammaproteobacteria bacterium]